MRDLGSGSCVQLRFTENVALHQHLTHMHISCCKNTASIYYRHNKRPSLRCWLIFKEDSKFMLRTWGYGQVKDAQQDDVMFVCIKMVAMVGKSGMKNGRVRRLRRDNLINHEGCGRAVDYNVLWLIIMTWAHAGFLEANTFYRQQKYMLHFPSNTSEENVILIISTDESLHCLLKRVQNDLLW